MSRGQGARGGGDRPASWRAYEGTWSLIASRGTTFYSQKTRYERLPEVREPSPRRSRTRVAVRRGACLPFAANRGDKVGLCAPCDLSSTGCRAVGCAGRVDRGADWKRRKIVVGERRGLPPPLGGRGKRHFFPSRAVADFDFRLRFPQIWIDFVMQNARSSPKLFHATTSGEAAGTARHSLPRRRDGTRLGERKQRCPSSRARSSPTTVTSRARSTSPTKSSSSEGTSDGRRRENETLAEGNASPPRGPRDDDPRRVAFPSSSPPQAKRVRRAPQVRRHLAQARHPRGAGERFGACPPRLSFPLSAARSRRDPTRRRDRSDVLTHHAFHARLPNTQVVLKNMSKTNPVVLNGASTAPARPASSSTTTRLFSPPPSRAIVFKYRLVAKETGAVLGGAQVRRRRRREGQRARRPSARGTATGWSPSPRRRRRRRPSPREKAATPAKKAPRRRAPTPVKKDDTGEVAQVGGQVPGPTPHTRASRALVASAVRCSSPPRTTPPRRTRRPRRRRRRTRRRRRRPRRSPRRRRRSRRRSRPRRGRPSRRPSPPADADQCRSDIVASAVDSLAAEEAAAMEAEEEPRKLRRRVPAVSKSPASARKSPRCAKKRVSPAAPAAVEPAAVEPAAALPLPPRRLAGGFPAKARRRRRTSPTP